MGIGVQQLLELFSADGAAYQRKIFIAQMDVKLSDALYGESLVVFKVNGAAHFADRFLVRDGWRQGLRFCLPVYPCRHLLAFCIRQVTVHLDKIFQPLADILPLKLFLIPQVILEIVKDAESLTVKIDEATSTISKRPRETADAVLFFEESYGFLFRFLLLEMVIDAVLAALKNAASCNDDVHIIFRYVTAIVRLGFFVVVCRQGCFDFFVLFFLGIDVVHFQRAYFIAARSIFRQVKGQLLVLTDSFFRVNGRDKFVVIDQCGDGSSNAVPRQMRFRAAGQVGPLPDKQTIAFFIESNAGIIFQQKLRKHDLVALADIAKSVDQQRCFAEKGKDVRIGCARGRICFQQGRQQFCRKFGHRKSGGRCFALRSCGFFGYTSYSIGRIISSACCFRLLHICAQPSGFVLRSGICAFCIRSCSVLSTICCASSPILRQLGSNVPSSIIWSHRFGSFCSK